MKDKSRTVKMVIADYREQIADLTAKLEAAEVDYKGREKRISFLMELTKTQKAEIDRLIGESVQYQQRAEKAEARLKPIEDVYKFIKKREIEDIDLYDDAEIMWQAIKKCEEDKP